MKRSILLLTSLCFYFTLLGQKTIPKNYFIDPLDINLVLSGTFGELRSNHFHSGLDIKTKGKTGLNVYASASGYVSRIKVQHYGYGKALYLQHPNGYTTVYAHLEKLSPKIEAYLKKEQYKKESYAIELFPSKDKLIISQGEVIGYSGNSGSSGGPHLHFEIRDAHERPMNPMLFGITTKDTRKPDIKKLYAYPLEKSQINGQISPQEIKLKPLANGNFRAQNINALGRIGFGIATTDKQDFANNNNGVYAIKTTLNGVTNFNVVMDKFSFSETRYLNRMIDYPFFKTYKSRIQKLFVEPNNPLSIYKELQNKGELYIENGFTYQYAIIVTDYDGNKVKIEVPITGKQESLLKQPKVKITPHQITPSESYTYEEGRWKTYLPKRAVYQSEYLDITHEANTLKVHNDKLPLHKNITISYNLDGYNDDDCEKMYIARYYKKITDTYYVGSTLKNGFLQAKTRTLGNFTIATDTQPPVITPQNITEGKWMSKDNFIKIKIDDSATGIKSFRATVNNHFILMEYDPKTKMLTHHFSDGIVTETKNNLKLIVTDNVGNHSIYTTTFYRKN